MSNPRGALRGRASAAAAAPALREGGSAGAAPPPCPSSSRARRPGSARPSASWSSTLPASSPRGARHHRLARQIAPDPGGQRQHEAAAGDAQPARSPARRRRARACPPAGSRGAPARQPPARPGARTAPRWGSSDESAAASAKPTAASASFRPVAIPIPAAPPRPASASRFEDPPMGSLGLGVGEGPVGRAVADGERQVLRSRPGAARPGRRRTGSPPRPAAPRASPPRPRPRSPRPPPPPPGRAAPPAGPGCAGSAAPAGRRRASASRCSSKASTPRGRSKAWATRGWSSPTTPRRSSPRISRAEARGWSQPSPPAPSTPRPWIPSASSRPVTAALAS